MLGRIGVPPIQVCQSQKAEPTIEQYIRNEIDDIKKAVEYLYEFKEKLSKLSYVAQEAINCMLQIPKY